MICSMDCHFCSQQVQQTSFSVLSVQLHNLVIIATHLGCDSVCQKGLVVCFSIVSKRHVGILLFCTNGASSFEQDC